MNSRSFLPLAVGTTGLFLGILAVVEGSISGLFAGIAAFGTGLIGYAMAKQNATTEQALVHEQRQADELEESVASQIQARIMAEDAVQSLSSELSTTQNNEQQRDERIEEQIREEVKSQGLVSGKNQLRDPATGLYSETYFRAAMETRVAAARRHLRPVAVVLVEVAKVVDGQREEVDPGPVAHVLRETLRESDTSCRTSAGLFALVLEDTPENGAVWTVERFRRQLADEQDGWTVWAGVACYPAHAFEVRDLVGKASEALESANDWKQDRIEVAIADA